MFNIHRNFFADNILKDLKIISKSRINKIPYKDNITLFNNNNTSLYFVDIDRITDLKDLKNDIYLINKNSFSIFILTSKNKNKLENFEELLIKKNINNISIINIFKIGIKKPIDIEREKILFTYLSLETQLSLSIIISKIISLKNNRDIRLLLLDLDDTCWSGIIGEDGISKIYLDYNQRNALKLIENLIVKTGLLISFHSKNNNNLAIKGISKKLVNYKNLIKKSFKFINWDPKIKSIKNITNIVNFSKNNIAFFDDNVAEIKQVNQFLKKKNCFWLKNSYLFFTYIKALYISNIDKTINKKRFKDIKSNIVREDVKNNKGLINYIKSSKLKVTFTLKNLDFSRCSEMSNKTNQFNANYCRYKIKEIKSLNKNKNYKIISFSASDKYSDSGAISLMVLEYKSTHFIIKEFVISCRALGRGLESFFLNLVIKKFSIQKLIINYIKTDRNMPFIKYLENIKISRNKKFYSINLVKVKKNIINYENYIKTEIN